MLRANRPATPGAPQGGAPAPMQQAAPAQPQGAPPAQQPQYAPPAQQPQYAPPAQQQYAPPAQQPQYAPPAQQPQYAPPAQQPQYAPPAQQQYQEPSAQPQYTPAPAPQYGTNLPAIPGGNNVAGMNQGVLENMDDIGSIGNYVTVDGSEFFYKSSERRATYLDVNVHYGKRYYQWVDEANPAAKQYNNSDTKLDDRYKLKGEIRWFEPSEEPNEEPTEFIHSLSTTSMIQFLDYLKKLASAGMGVGQVWTRCTISRHETSKSKDRYSRVDFAAYSLEDGSPLNIVSNA